MAIVWHTSMTAREYAAAGENLDVPRQRCPGCSAAMNFWGSYERTLRLGDDEVRLVLRRARCARCRRSHALIPDLVALNRLDAVEVIGGAIAAVAAGATTMATAVSAGLPYTTVRGWRRRFASRAGLLASGFLAATVALGDLVPRLRVGELSIALTTLSSAAAALRRRFGLAGGDWALANLIVGGHLFSTNTNPPWIAA